MLGFAAVNTGNNLLFIIVSGLLAFMSVTGMAGMYNIKGLTPELLPPEEIYAGIPALFRLSVNNTKRYLPSFLIRLECRAEHSLLFAVVPSRSSCHGTVQLTFDKRGTPPPLRITITSQYPVGFFTRFWTFESSAPVTVFPHPVAAEQVGGGDDSPATGSGYCRERGMNGEIERIYPYSGSEPLRMIHWKHSARTHDLLVKGFGSSVAAPLVIDLNMLSGEGAEERLSRAAWLIKRWVLERPVGMLLDGRLISAGSGKTHGLKLLKELALYGSD